MKLENIGFYTMSDDRISQVSGTSPMWRCELILTERCNFRCTYCRGLRKDCQGDMSIQDAKNVLDIWSKTGLKNVRFSGGEPTVYKGLTELVAYSKSLGVERIAISTNGSAPRVIYDKLLEAGVNDFSISLDACCAADGDMMAGVKGKFDRVVDSIRYLSSKTYVTVGVVLTQDNIGHLKETVEFAHSLGVADIRIISAAQCNDTLQGVLGLSKELLEAHPILKYRVENMKNGRHVRGIQEGDTKKCHLGWDDGVVAGNKHFPCVIYLREGGNPIGEVGPGMREEKIAWVNSHNAQEDKICRNNCLDVCIDYNNKFREMRGEEK